MVLHKIPTYRVGASNLQPWGICNSQANYFVFFVLKFYALNYWQFLIGYDTHCIMTTHFIKYYGHLQGVLPLYTMQGDWYLLNKNNVVKFLLSTACDCMTKSCDHENNPSQLSQQRKDTLRERNIFADATPVFDDALTHAIWFQSDEPQNPSKSFTVDVLTHATRSHCDET